MGVVYVVMIKAQGNVIMSDHVFANQDQAKHYVTNQNKKVGRRGYYYLERCLFN